MPAAINVPPEADLDRLGMLPPFDCLLTIVDAGI